MTPGVLDIAGQSQSSDTESVEVSIKRLTSCDRRSNMSRVTVNIAEEVSPFQSPP